MGCFLNQWGAPIVGADAHVALDRHPKRRAPAMSVAVFVLLVSFWGAGVGAIMQWAAHDSTEPMNVRALPTDFLLPAIALVLLVLSWRIRPRHSLLWRGADRLGER